MTQGAKKAKRDKFIKLMVTVDDARGMIAAYKKVYPNCKKDSSARINSYKLLQEPGIIEAIDKLKVERAEMIREAEKQLIQKEARERIISDFQIDAALSDIVVGKRKRERKVIIYNHERKKYEELGLTEESQDKDIVNAADKLYRRKGSYAAINVKHEGGDQLINFLKAVSNTGNKNIPNDIQSGSHK